MSAMTLPPLNPAPIPTQLVAPPAPAANNTTGPGSFSQLLEAADARRQTEAPSPAAPEKTASNANNGARPPAAAQKPGPREASKTERGAGQTDADNNTAERDGARIDEAGSDDDAAPADAATLLANLELIHRAPARDLASAEPANARGRAGAARQALESRLDASQARTGASAGIAAGAAERRTVDPAFAGLLAAAQGGEAATASTAALTATEQRLARQAEARSADAGALGALLGTGATPAAPSAGSSAAHPAEARLSTTPGQAGFAEQLGAQLSTFVREGVQHARLQLHPLELGPVTVQIQLDGGSAHMSFAAEHAQTRLALEQALPTLAGSLREAGLTLSGGGVFEQPRQPPPEGDGGRGDGGNGSRGGGAGQGGTDDGAVLQAAAGAATRRRGVVDLVA